MAKLSFDLYLDESGNFEKDGNGYSMVSLVGGLLIPSSKITEAKLNSLIKNPIHAKEHYEHDEYFKILHQLVSDGGHFIIFQNDERISVINGDFTYLNIISEGIVQLLRNLRVQYPSDHITLNILIAQRQAVAYKRDMGISDSAKINQDEYFTRIDEKLYISLGRNNINHMDWNIEFGVAERDKKLMLADLICFTYRFRKGKDFSSEEQQDIQRMIESEYIYSVFENATIGYIKKLIIDQRYDEAICQICTVKDRNMISDLQNNLISRLVSLSRKELQAHMDYISIQIGQYNNSGLYVDGITFAENYKRYILDSIINMVPSLADAISFARFDTDFYILTMYDHIGNVKKCQKYLQSCRDNISSVNRSWEHIDYYFNFCIRELNVMMGRFEFDDVIEKSSELEKIFLEARDLFSMIKTYNGTEQIVRSELLGKVYSVKSEAIINILYRRPDLLENAQSALTQALEEFTNTADIARTYQWKCLLMVESRNSSEAIHSLLQAINVQNEEKPFNAFVDTAFNLRPHIWEFLFWHYTNVMILLKEEGDSRAEEMAKALFTHGSYKDEISNDERKGHPWNLVLWNIGRYMRLNGNHNSYATLYKKAVALSRFDRNNTTMMTFSISMEADCLLWLRENNKKEARTIESEFLKHIKSLKDLGQTEAMNNHFRINEILEKGIVDNSILKEIKDIYLK